MDFIEERDNSKANEKNRSDDVIEFVKKIEIDLDTDVFDRYKHHVGTK